MAEPQPANATEIEEQPAPAAAEDRKAAAALSNLSDDAPAASKSDADQKALGEAMSRLEVMEKSSKAGEIAKTKGEPAAKKEKIKVKAEDVALLVDALEVGKVKAGEMLREEGGDVGKVLDGWIKSGIPA